jgi:hypothetical protein
MSKLDFLQTDYIQLLESLDENTTPIFGKMNVLQMIEHMCYAVQQATGRISLKPINDEETTEKMYRFMMSEKPFRDNTPNPYLPDEPAKPSSEDKAVLIANLNNDINNFVQHYTADNAKRELNPFFGNLNFDEWTHLLHKHAWHHLRQFGVVNN